MRYAVDLRHPLQAPAVAAVRVEGVREDICPVVEAVGIRESRRDIQRVWEEWEAGFMAFHAFHTLSFPWPAFRCKRWINDIAADDAMCHTRLKVLIGTHRLLRVHWRRRAANPTKQADRLTP
jgi:hypothetical protein